MTRFEELPPPAGWGAQREVVGPLLRWTFVNGRATVEQTVRAAGLMMERAQKAGLPMLGVRFLRRVRVKLPSRRASLRTQFRVVQQPFSLPARRLQPERLSELVEAAKAGDLDRMASFYNSDYDRLATAEAEDFLTGIPGADGEEGQGLTEQVLDQTLVPGFFEMTASEREIRADSVTERGAGGSDLVSSAKFNERWPSRTWGRKKVKKFSPVRLGASWRVTIITEYASAGWGGGVDDKLCGLRAFTFANNMLVARGEEGRRPLRTDTLIRECGVPQLGPYRITDMRKIARFYRISSACIHGVLDGTSDELDWEPLWEPEATESVWDHDLILLLRDEHFYLVRRVQHDSWLSLRTRRTRRGPCLQEHMPRVLLYAGFDLETTFNGSGHLSSYLAVARTQWVSAPRKQPPNARTISPEELEELQPPPQARCISGGRVEERLADSVGEMEDWALTVAHRQGIFVEIIYWTYNGSRFDMLLFAEHMMALGRLAGDGLFLAENSVLRIKIGRHVAILDLCRFTMCPLQKALKNFNCPTQKGHMDHGAIQEASEDGVLWPQFWREQGERITEYCEKDVVGMLELASKLRDVFLKETGLEMHESMTIGQLGYRYWSNLPELQQPWWMQEVERPPAHERWPLDVPGRVTGADAMRSNNYRFGLRPGEPAWGSLPPEQLATLVAAPELEECDRLCRHAYVGGRCQTYREGEFDGHFQSFDVSGLYAYVMMYGEFPAGRCREVGDGEEYRWEDGHMGVYYVDIENQHPDTFNVVPRRVKGQALDWTWKGPIKGAGCSTVMIHMLRLARARFRVRHGYVWEGKSKKYFQFLRRWGEIKKEMDRLRDAGMPFNEALREIAKLFQNLFSGKSAQRYRTIIHRLLVNCDDVERFMRSTLEGARTFVEMRNGIIMAQGESIEAQRYVRWRRKPSHLALYIYDLSKYHMWVAGLNRVPPNMIYLMDTDSMVIDTRALATLVQEPLPEVAGVCEGPNRWMGRFTLGRDFGQFHPELEAKDCTDLVAARDAGAFQVWKEGEPEMFGATKVQVVGKKLYRLSVEIFLLVLHTLIVIFDKTRFKGVRLSESTLPPERVQQRFVEDHPNVGTTRVAAERQTAYYLSWFRALTLRERLDEINDKWVRMRRSAAFATLLRGYELVVAARFLRRSVGGSGSICVEQVVQFKRFQYSTDCFEEMPNLSMVLEVAGGGGGAKGEGVAPLPASAMEEWDDDMQLRTDASTLESLEYALSMGADGRRQWFEWGEAGVEECE